MILWETVPMDSGVCSLYSLTTISSYSRCFLSPLAMESGAVDSHWMDEFPVPMKYQSVSLQGLPQP